jgi:hypothetical protein
MTVTSSTTITLASTASTVVLNATDSNGVTWVLKQDGGFTGWGGVAPTIQVVQKPRQPGGWAGLSYGQSRYPTFNVRVYAPSAAALNTAVDSLNAAVDFTSATMTVAEAGVTRSMTVRRNSSVDVSKVTSRVADVQFQVVAVDPRKLGTALTQQTALPATSGGLTVPFTIPFTITSTVVAGQINLTNPGNESGPVVVRIDGPCTGPIITHTSSTTTNALVFSSNLSLGAGEFLLVDMDKHTALANGQTTRAGYITSRGWSLFDPGANTWAFTASTYNSGSLLTVTASPAWK